MRLDSNYVDEATAQSKNLTYANGNTFILRADDTTVLSASDPGRDSVRMQSNNQYSTHVTVYVPPAPIIPPRGANLIFSSLLPPRRM